MLSMIQFQITLTYSTRQGIWYTGHQAKLQFRNTGWNRILKQCHQGSQLNVTGNKELRKAGENSKREFILEFIFIQKRSEIYFAE